MRGAALAVLAVLAWATAQSVDGIQKGLEDEAARRQEWRAFVRALPPDGNEILDEGIALAERGLAFQALPYFRLAAAKRRDPNVAMNLAITELRAGNFQRAYLLMRWALETAPSDPLIRRNWEQLFARSAALPAAVSDADLLTLHEQLRSGVSMAHEFDALAASLGSVDDIRSIRELEAVDSGLLRRAKAPEFRPLPRFTAEELVRPENRAFAEGRLAFVLTGAFATPEILRRRVPGGPAPAPGVVMSATELVDRYAAAQGRNVSGRTRGMAWLSADRGGELVDSALFRQNILAVKTSPVDSTMRESVSAMKAHEAGRRERAARGQRRPSPYTLWRPDPAVWADLSRRLRLGERMPPLLRQESAWLGPGMTPAGRQRGWDRSRLDVSGTGATVGEGAPGAAGMEARELANEFMDVTRWRLAAAGAGGAGMFLHFDGIHLASWQLQLAGRKTWVVCPPTETRVLYPIGTWDHMAPAWRRIPLVKTARCFNTTLYPGEVIFYPKGYFHGTHNHASAGGRWDAEDGLAVALSGSAITADTSFRIRMVLERECVVRSKVDMHAEDGGAGFGAVGLVAGVEGIKQGGGGELHAVPSRPLCEAMRDHLFGWWEAALHGRWVAGGGEERCGTGR